MPFVHCPYCGRQQAVPAELLRELAAFQRQFSGQKVEADEAVRTANAWRDFSHQAGPIGPGLAIAFSLLMLLPVAAARFADQVLDLVVPVPAVYAVYVPLLAALYALGRLRLASRKKPGAARQRVRQEQAELGVQRVACPLCGAPNDYDPRRGAAADCAYCRSALFPTRDVLAQALDAARLAKRRALLDTYRLARAATAKLAIELRAPHVGTFGEWKPALVASLVVAGVLGGMSKELLEGKLPDLPALYALWLLLPLGWLVFGLSLARKHARRRRLEAALSNVAQQGRGSSDSDVSAYVAWLDEHWAGPYDVPYDSLGTWFYSVRVRAGRYAGLAELNLEARNLKPAHVRVLLAAWLPGISDNDQGTAAAALPAAAHSFHDRLYALGCSLELTGAGLIARMDLDHARVEALARDPESASVLSSVFAELAAHADQLGAV